MSARTAVTNHVQSSQINMKTTISKSNIDIMTPFPGDGITDLSLRNQPRQRPSD